METYTIKKTFYDLRNSIIETKVFYGSERTNAKGETKKIIEKIYNILDTATKGVYEIEKTDENYLKGINKFLKAYQKIEKYKQLLTY